MPIALFFPFLGPSRRHDRKVVEIRLDFSADASAGQLVDVAEIRKLLQSSGVLEQNQAFPAQALPEDPAAGYSYLLTELALLFQRRAGHRVEVQETRLRSEKHWLALVEHQHCDVGMAAVKLSIDLLNGQCRHLAQPYKSFLQFARQRKVPIEAEAIMRAATEQGIPYFQLEQQPFTGAQKTGYRVRPGGLLMLGHGAYASVLDGSICMSLADKKTLNLLVDATARAELLERLGLCRSDATGCRVLHMLAAGSATLAWFEEPEYSRLPAASMSAEWLNTLAKVQKAVHGQPVRLKLALHEKKPARVVDFELGPDLGRLWRAEVPESAEDLGAAAIGLVNWLVPDPEKSRVPLVAITGTNGKTTTSRMVNHILLHAGMTAGLICTDGSFVSGRQISDKDESSMQGHGRVLTHPGVDAAVLETHHRGIAVQGFAFIKCDVAICLNVTEEHLKKGEIETVEEMARIKAALPQRGRVAVLFVDDPHCRAMAEQGFEGQLWLVSIEFGVDELRSLANGNLAGLCLLEELEGREWVVLYEGNERLPLMALSDIPATFDGAARFNAINAMHAIVAAHCLGISHQAIIGAMSGFHASAEMTPGRMNVFDQLPFQVVMDFAHNPGGVARIAEFADRQKPVGRKVLAFGGPFGRETQTWREIGSAAAGHFDLYVCKDYPPREGMPDNNSVPHVRQGLLDSGVPAEQISTAGHGRSAAFEVFDACRPGDLLIFLVGHVEKNLLAGYIDDYLECRQSID